MSRTIAESPLLGGGVRLPFEPSSKGDFAIGRRMEWPVPRLLCPSAPPATFAVKRSRLARWAERLGAHAEYNGAPQSGVSPARRIHFPADSIPHPGDGSMRINAGDLGSQVLVGLEPKEGHCRATVATDQTNSHNPLNRQAAGMLSPPGRTSPGGSPVSPASSRDPTPCTPILPGFAFGPALNPGRSSVVSCYGHYSAPEVGPR